MMEGGAAGRFQSKNVRSAGAILGEECWFCGEEFWGSAEENAVVRFAGPRADPKFCANSEFDANCAVCVRVKNNKVKTILNDNE